MEKRLERTENDEKENIIMEFNGKGGTIKIRLM